MYFDENIYKNKVEYKSLNKCERNNEKNIHFLHLIEYGMKNEFSELLAFNKQYNVLRDKSNHNTLILLNFKLDHKSGYIDYYDTNENIYYLYYPENIANSYGAGHNYMIDKAKEFEQTILKCKVDYYVRMDPDLKWQCIPYESNCWQKIYNNDFKVSNNNINI